MFEKYLEDIGLSDKEAAIYVALLGYDNATVSDLAKKVASVKRTTIYPVLESLMKKGLVSEVELNNKVLYQAEPPERLETFVERQKVLFEEKARMVKDIMPQLKSVQREGGERPVVKYFEGRDGIISCSEEFFAPGVGEKVAYMIYPRDLLENLFTDAEREKFRNIRLDKDVRTRSLYTYSKGHMSYDADAERYKLDASKYPVSCDIAIHGDRVRISILGGKLSSIFIKSQEFAETMKTMFRLAIDNLNTKPDQSENQ